MSRVNYSLRLVASLWASGLLSASIATFAQAPAAGSPPAGDEGATEPRARPQFLAWVEGSPVENTIWRGWPAVIHVQASAGSAPSAVSLRGTAEIPLIRTNSAAVWVLTAMESARLAPGSLTLMAGNQTVAVTVADSPASLTPAQRSLHSRLLVQGALLAGDSPAARSAAEAWVQAEPNSPTAHELRGDVLAAQGDLDGALAAYQEAAGHLPPQSDPPPRGLPVKINAILRQRVTPSAGGLPAAPSADEVQYFNLIDGGDKLLAADKPPEAERHYAEAATLHAARHLTVSTAELDEKQAFLASTTTAGAPATGGPNVVKTLPAASATNAGSNSVASANVETTAAPALPANPSTPTAAAADPNAPPPPGTVVPLTELAETKIVSDSNGQWTVSAQASSEYSTPNYGAVQLVGRPNVKDGGDSTLAWCPAASARGLQWIELTFAQPVHATEVRVRQSYNPGAIVEIETFAADNSVHLWWSGIDPERPSGALNAIAWFAVRVPETDYLVSRVRITLDIDAVASWQQIDAVQLVGKPPH